MNTALETSASTNSTSSSLQFLNTVRGILSLKKDEEKTFDARFFYALKANQKNYLSVENYNQMLQKYHNGNFRLGLIGSVICLAVAILGLFF